MLSGSSTICFTEIRETEATREVSASSSPISPIGDVSRGHPMFPITLIELKRLPCISGRDAMVTWSIAFKSRIIQGPTVTAKPTYDLTERHTTLFPSLRNSVCNIFRIKFKLSQFTAVNEDSSRDFTQEEILNDKNIPSLIRSDTKLPLSPAAFAALLKFNVFAKVPHRARRLNAVERASAASLTIGIKYIRLDEKTPAYLSCTSSDIDADSSHPP
ncbi:hypothetical protein C8Q75DRAFT_782175 [Abortiporus biennis]|nr:hypothetical protein C8Q75DRAFT_782175 [Abortiporus biennis]